MVTIAELEVLFIVGFGPIVRDSTRANPRNLTSRSAESPLARHCAFQRALDLRLATADTCLEAAVPQSVRPPYLSANHRLNFSFQRHQ